MATPGPSGVKAPKRKLDIIVDPDSLKTIEESKKPKKEFDEAKKQKCLTAIVNMYEFVINQLERSLAESSMEMDTETIGVKETPKAPLPVPDDPHLTSNITVGNHIISIIFTLHNICRQEKRTPEANMIKKTEKTTFKVMIVGKEHAIPNEVAKTAWIGITTKQGLEYKKFDEGDPTDWYGTMGPYLDMFSAYSLRTNELRLGHNNMPITKVEGVHKSFPVSKYGLSGAHHVLLEGASFPPERRSSIVQSLGPMTAWICMIRTEGRYRKKNVRAVKRAMAHIPCIDDLIDITKGVKQADEISTVTAVIAEIFLVTTARQATRMFFPITMFASVWKAQPDKTVFSKFFSTTGVGGWYTYKMGQRLGEYYVAGLMEEEKAAQIAFHSMFGTYKEDLSILSQITWLFGSGWKGSQIINIAGVTEKIMILFLFKIT